MGARPKRDRRSRIRPELGARTEELEDLAVEMYARGLSTRDIEAALCDERGHSLLSRTAVSQVTERLWRSTRHSRIAICPSTRSREDKYAAARQFRDNGVKGILGGILVFGLGAGMVFT